MTLVNAYLWYCCAFAVLASVVFGVLMLAGGPGRDRSAWPLVGWVTALCLGLQSGYLLAPLAASAQGAWWRWAVAGMAPIAFVAAVAVGTNLWLWLRFRLSGGGGRLDLGRTSSLVILTGVYIGAPLVLWATRS